MLKRIHKRLIDSARFACNPFSFSLLIVSAIAIEIAGCCRNSINFDGIDIGCIPCDPVKRLLFCLISVWINVVGTAAEYQSLSDTTSAAPFLALNIFDLTDSLSNILEVFGARDVRVGLYQPLILLSGKYTTYIYQP